MDTDGHGGDVLEDEAGVFIGKGNILLGADSDLGCSVLIVVFDDKESLIESEFIALSESSLNYRKNTSTPYLMLSLCLATRSSLYKSRCWRISENEKGYFLQLAFSTLRKASTLSLTLYPKRKLDLRRTLLQIP